MWPTCTSPTKPGFRLCLEPACLCVSQNVRRGFCSPLPAPVEPSISGPEMFGARRSGWKLRSPRLPVCGRGRLRPQRRNDILKSIFSFLRQPVLPPTKLQLLLRNLLVQELLELLVGPGAPVWDEHLHHHEDLAQGHRRRRVG